MGPNCESTLERQSRACSMQGVVVEQGVSGRSGCDCEKVAELSPFPQPYFAVTHASQLASCLAQRKASGYQEGWMLAADRVETCCRSPLDLA